MGGLLILLVMTIATLLWAALTNDFIWLALLVTLGYGLIGWLDDYLKIMRRRPQRTGRALEATAAVPVWRHCCRRSDDDD